MTTDHEYITRTDLDLTMARLEMRLGEKIEGASLAPGRADPADLRPGHRHHRRGGAVQPEHPLAAAGQLTIIVVMTTKQGEVEAHKRIAEEAWQRGLHMRDTEVAELREERDDAIEAEKIAVREIGAENDRLRAALTRYGRHLLTCSFFKDGPHQASPKAVCDCGLVAAIEHGPDAW